MSTLNKYVVIKNRSSVDAKEYIYLFDNDQIHRHVGNRLRSLGEEIISAGFFHVKSFLSHDNKMLSGAICFSYSDSLNLLSRPNEDSRLLNALLYFNTDELFNNSDYLNEIKEALNGLTKINITSKKVKIHTKNGLFDFSEITSKMA